MLPTNNLNDLTAAWSWAKENTGICHESVDQHVQNIEKAINDGFEIIPILSVDTLDTLRRFNENDPENDNLIQFMESLCGDSFKNAEKTPLIISSSFQMAVEFIYAHENIRTSGISCEEKRTIHRGFGETKELLEMLIDDEADVSEHKKHYVSAVLPTWDKKLIRFPK